MAVFSRQFYHSTIKNLTIGFGKLFSDIHIVRTNGTKLVKVEVPCTFSPKEKFVQRITQDPKLDRQAAIQFPRMAFEMVSMNYDPQRKLPKQKRIVLYNSSASGRAYSYTPVPYDLTFQLYITTKTLEDMYQIVEQIIPAFTPDYVLNLRSTQTEASFDIPIFLDGVSGQDTYDGAFEEDRTILWSLTFVMKAVFFSPIRGGTAGDDGPIIKEIDVYTYGKDTTVEHDHLHFVPYIDGVPLVDIEEDDPWTMKVTIDKVFP